MNLLNFYLRHLSVFLLLGVSSIAGATVDFKATGFGSLYYAQSLRSDITPYGFSSSTSSINNKADFTHFSLIGSDLSAKFDEQWSVFTELIATGQPGVNTDFNNFVQTAFINFTPFEDVTVKLGRQRYPILMASEVTHTHFLRPDRETPAIVYKSAPFTIFDGLSVNKTFALASMKLTLGAFGGTPFIDTALAAGSTTSLNSLIGGKATLDGDGWRARMQAFSYVSNQVDTNPAVTMKAAPKVFSVGYRYDKYNIVSWAEYVVRVARDGSDVPNLSKYQGGGTYLGSTESFYTLIGYRIGNWLPRYEFSHSNQAVGKRNGSVASNIIGVNYKISDNLIAKAEFEYDTIPAAQGGVSVTQSPTSTGTSTSAIYSGIDFMF